MEIPMVKDIDQIQTSNNKFLLYDEFSEWTKFRILKVEKENQWSQAILFIIPFQ